jgi:hypothetical protein
VWSVMINIGIASTLPTPYSPPPCSQARGSGIRKSEEGRRLINVNQRLNISHSTRVGNENIITLPHLQNVYRISL